MKLTTDLNCEDYTILIVDDTPINLGVVTDYLEAYGFEIMVAQEGQSALDKAHHAPPHLILLDVMMPGIDGFETCRRLKASEVTKDIPVIFMTALSATEDKVNGFKAGAVDYVVKPLQQEEVLARVTTHLRMRTLTKNLQKANRELTELNASKDKFFSIVAHDLRSPFMPLLGNSELLSILADTAPRTEIKEMSAGIHHTAKNVYNLLENLLQWSRMQREQMEYQADKLELEQIVQQNVKLLAENAVTKDINLQSRIVEGLAVYADENMLNTVIRNLVSNALKFTSRGGQVTISTRVEQTAPDFAEISVMDTGVGISEADLQKLFTLEVHHTTKGTNQEDGTGLGLIICQEMVEKNGGQIWVESKLGQGTTLKFTVPLDSSVSGSSFLAEVDYEARIIDHTDSMRGNKSEAVKEIVIPPPPDELAILLDLAKRGDMIGLKKRATQLKTTNQQWAPFAGKVYNLAKSFEDEQILTFLEGYLEIN